MTVPPDGFRMRLESVGKRDGPRQPWVVREVSSDLPPGRLIRLEGPNGSGKSTLLRVASGVSPPSAGRVIGRPHTGGRLTGECRAAAEQRYATRAVSALARHRAAAGGRLPACHRLDGLRARRRPPGKEPSVMITKTFVRYGVQEFS